VAHKKNDIVKYCVSTQVDGLGQPARNLCKLQSTETSQTEQEVFGLILASKVGNYQALEDLWSCPHIWTFDDLMALSKAFISLGDAKAMGVMLNSIHTASVLGSVPFSLSSEFVKLVDENQQKEAVKANFSKMYSSSDLDVFYVAYCLAKDPANQHLAKAFKLMSKEDFYSLKREEQFFASAEANLLKNDELVALSKDWKDEQKM